MPDGIVGGTENSQGKLVIICNFMLIAEKKDLITVAPNCSLQINLRQERENKVSGRATNSCICCMCALCDKAHILRATIIQ